jgi:hypothetical protein
MKRSLVLLLVLPLVLCAFACGGRTPSQEASVSKDKTDDSYDGELIISGPALEGFIKLYCTNKSKATGGLLTVHDAASNADLKLKLAKVRPADPQPETSPGHFYVCADMTDESGGTYDVDFVYKKTPRGIEISEILVHKDPTHTHYDWVQGKENRFWVRQPQG